MQVLFVRTFTAKTNPFPLVAAARSLDRVSLKHPNFFKKEYFSPLIPHLKQGGGRRISINTLFKLGGVLQGGLTLKNHMPRTTDLRLCSIHQALIPPFSPQGQRPFFGLLDQKSRRAHAKCAHSTKREKGPNGFSNGAHPAFLV